MLVNLVTGVQRKQSNANFSGDQKGQRGPRRSTTRSLRGAKLRGANRALCSEGKGSLSLCKGFEKKESEYLCFPNFKHIRHLHTPPESSAHCLNKATPQSVFQVHVRMSMRCQYLCQHLFLPSRYTYTPPAVTPSNVKPSFTQCTGSYALVRRGLVQYP